jgi:hypothetical protein
VQQWLQTAAESRHRAAVQQRICAAEKSITGTGAKQDRAAEQYYSRGTAKQEIWAAT